MQLDKDHVQSKEELMRAVSLQARMTVFERHKLEPVNGQYHFTDEMAAGAAAIDEAQGTSMGPRSSRT